jgi:hypothetical protein
MLTQRQHSVQVSDPDTTPVEVCRYCGVIDAPLLSPGTGPHACQASCQHCGRHWRWVSLLAPAERQARRTKARLAAMQQLPPSAAQLSFLQELGDKATAPQNMGEASARIEALKREKRR